MNSLSKDIEEFISKESEYSSYLEENWPLPRQLVPRALKHAESKIIEARALSDRVDERTPARLVDGLILSMAAYKRAIVKFS